MYSRTAPGEAILTLSAELIDQQRDLQSITASPNVRGFFIINPMYITKYTLNAFLSRFGEPVERVVSFTCC